jgi:UDP-glucuronate decarboxylase
MKQLHKSPTHAPSPAHAPASKVSKPARPGPRTWVGYLLREQRLLFVLLGALIATSFFLLRPYLFSLSPSSVVDHSPIFSFVSHSSPSRVPAGFRPPPRRVVVTGGAGFVGSHLVDRLLEQGNSVIVVDNFFTGRKENVAHHAGNPNFEMIRHDVVEPILLEVDQIYHLACPASPVHYKYNPVKTIKTNVVGTLNMLGLAKRVGARFLLTSTSEVYGDPLQHPQVETYWGNVNPIGVRSCYDEGKRTAETLTMDYHRGASLEVRHHRSFNHSPLGQLDRLYWKRKHPVPFSFLYLEAKTRLL